MANTESGQVIHTIASVADWQQSAPTDRQDGAAS
jgi:hypothetical protein